MQFYLSAEHVSVFLKKKKIYDRENIFVNSWRARFENEIERDFSLFGFLVDFGTFGFCTICSKIIFLYFRFFHFIFPLIFCFPS